MRFDDARQFVAALSELGAERDQEVELLATFSPVCLSLRVDDVVFDAELGATSPCTETLHLAGSLTDWTRLFEREPAPEANGVLALSRYSTTFSVESPQETLVRHLRTLNQWLSTVRRRLDQVTAAAPDLAMAHRYRGSEPATGTYVSCIIDDNPQRIYYESAGSGPAIVCLHTAGSDSRQYDDMLHDLELTSSYRVIAFDLPGHGKSMPKENWWLEEYRLTRETYIATVRAFCHALDLENPIVVGCSMGGSLVLHLALEHPEEFAGVIGFSGAAKVTGRFADWSLRPDVNAHQSVPSWTYGLMAPQSPEAHRRSVWWQYAQGGPGVYRGDTYFYSEDSDLRDRIAEIDTQACPVYLWTGEYDHACTPQDTLDTLDANRGIVGGIVAGIGHFPVAENYVVVRDLIHDAIRRISDRGHLASSP